MDGTLTKDRAVGEEVSDVGKFTDEVVLASLAKDCESLRLTSDVDGVSAPGGGGDDDGEASLVMATFAWYIVRRVL
jgi:hypothetical protein